MSDPWYVTTLPLVRRTALRHLAPPGPASLSHPAYTWSAVDASTPQSQPSRCWPRRVTFSNAYVLAATAWASSAAIGQSLGTSEIPNTYGSGETTATTRSAHGAHPDM